MNNFKKFQEPTDFTRDIVWSLVIGEGTRRDIFLATAKEGRMLYDLMKINGKNLDGTELFRRFKSTGPVTSRDVEASLVTGKTLRQPLETKPDPDVQGQVPCMGLEHKGEEDFIPVVFQTNRGELRGVFAEFKRDEVMSRVLPEFQAGVLANLEKTTRVVYPDGRIPNQVLIGAKCLLCQRNDRPRYEGGPGDTTRYLPGAGVRDHALERDGKILDAKSRNARRKGTMALFDRKSKRDGGGKSSSDREGRGGYPKRTDERPRADFHGASYLDETTATLVAGEKSGKLTGGLEQVASASNDFLRSLGVAGSDRAYDTIRSIARRVMEQQAEAVKAQGRAMESISAPTHLGDVARIVIVEPKPAPRGKGEKKNKKDGWGRQSRRNSVDGD